jgi:hypothetical protein
MDTDIERDGRKEFGKKVMELLSSAIKTIELAKEILRITESLGEK